MVRRMGQACIRLWEMQGDKDEKEKAKESEEVKEKRKRRKKKGRGRITGREEHKRANAGAFFSGLLE